MTHHLTIRARRWTVPVALVAALGLAVPTAYGSTSSGDQAPPPIGVEMLTPRSEFTDHVSAKIKVKLEGRRERTKVLNMRDPSHTAVARITVQPGAQFPWHTHPGPVIVNVSSGGLTYVQAKDCVERPYLAGAAFVDPGRGNVHTAFNPSDDVTVLVATFLEVPEEGPVTITEGVEPPENCEIEVGTHAH